MSFALPVGHAQVSVGTCLRLSPAVVLAQGLRMTPLHYALLQGRKTMNQEPLYKVDVAVAIAKRLLAAGASPSTPDKVCLSLR
jgi:hypothetical protein